MLARPTAVKHAGDRGFRVDPETPTGRLERDEHTLSRHHGIGGSHERPVQRQVLESIGDETKVSFADDLTGESNGVAGGAAVGPGKGAAHG